MDTIEINSKTAVEHRKKLRRYVVLAFEGRMWIARRGFFSKRRAVRHARYLESWGITIEAQVIDTRESGPIYKDEWFDDDGV